MIPVAHCSRPAYILALSLLAALPAAGGLGPPEPSVRLSGPVAEGYYRLTVRSARRGVWSDSALSPVAAVIPGRRMILYEGRRHEENVLVGRRFDGKGLFQSEADGLGIAGMAAGNRLVLLTTEGPQWGIVAANPANWDEILESIPLALVRLHDGSVVWTSDLRHAGIPLWTNDAVFVSIGFGPARRRFRHGRRHRAVWLEERSVYGRRLLWQRRIAGVPPLHFIATRVGARSLRLRFQVPRREAAWFRRHPWDDVGIFAYLRRLTVRVPVLRGTVAWEQPTVIYGNGEVPEAPMYPCPHSLP